MALPTSTPRSRFYDSVIVPTSRFPLTLQLPSIGKQSPCANPVHPKCSHDNGATYSVDLYSALPTRVESNYLSCDAVGASFSAYLDWDEARSPGAWAYAVEYLPRSVEKTPDLVIGSMALRKEDSEFARRRYINAYATAVYADHPAAVGS